MRVIAKLIKFVIAICLIALISLVIVLVVAQNTILNKQYIIENLENSNYYNNVYSISKSNFQKYIYQSGLPIEVLDDIISVEQIEKDTIQIVSTIYEGGVSPNSSEELKSKLFENIDESLETDFDKLDEATKENIEQFIELLATEYSKTIMDYGEVLDKGEVVKEAQELVEKIIVRIAIVIAVLIVAVFICSIGKMYTSFGTLSIAFMTVGVLNIAIHICKNAVIDITKISIMNDAVTIFARNIYNDVFGKILFGGIVVLVLGFVCCVISSVIKEKEIK